MLQAGIQYNDIKPIPHWDKNGKIYYTDSQGNKIENQQPILNQIGNNLKAFATNLNRSINNPTQEEYKRNANIALALATMPIGAGAGVTQAIAKPLVPYVGKKIATSVASGIGGGGLSGAIEGLGRGLIEQENPLLTAAQDMVLGSVGGALVGGVVGKVGKNIAKKQLAKNPVARNQYAQDYLEGLNKNKLNRELADYRGAVQNTFNGNSQTLNNFIGENAFNAPKGKLMEAKQMAMYGDSNADIRNATGWFKGVDGKWRYEIPDGKIIDNPKLIENFDEDIGTYYTGKLSDIYDAPELYQAYPQLRNRDISIQSLKPQDYGASYDDSIVLNRDLLYRKDNPEFLKLKAELENTPEYKKYDLAYNTDSGDTLQDIANMDKAQEEFFNTDVGKKYHSLMWDKSYPIQRKIKGFNDDALNTITHELQHQIQDIEGFATGGNLTSHSKLGRRYQDIKAKEINEQIINAYPELEKAFPKQGLALSKELQDYMFKSNYGHILNESDYPIMMNMNDKGSETITKILEDAKPDIYTEELNKISQYQNLSPAEYYKRMAGEAEARLAGARAKLTPEQRQIYNPANESTYLTNYGYDVMPEKQIVEFRNNEPSFSKKIPDDEFNYEKAMDEVERLKTPKPIDPTLKKEGEIAIMKGSEPFEKGEIDKIITDTTFPMSDDEISKGYAVRYQNEHSYIMYYDKNGKHTMGKFKITEEKYD